MKKIFWVVLALIVFINVGCGCSSFGLSSEDKIKKQDYKKQAKIITIDYIKNKYGFKPRIVKVVVETSRDSLGPLYLTGEVTVTLKYKKQKFIAKVYPEKGTARDNYQIEQIEKDIQLKLQEIFHKKPYYFDGGFNEKYPKYYSEYYNGSNLNKFISYFEADFINADTLSETDLKKLEQLTMNVGFKIYNYKSKSSNKKMQDKKHYYHIDANQLIYLKGYYVKSYMDNFNVSSSNVDHSTEKIEKYDINIKDDNIMLVVKDSKIGKIYNALNYQKANLDNTELNRIINNSFDYNVLDIYNVGNQNIDYVYLKQGAYKFSGDLYGMVYCKTSTLPDKTLKDYYFNTVDNYLGITIESNNCDNRYFILFEIKN